METIGRESGRLALKMHAQWCHDGASLLDQFPQKKQLYTNMTYLQSKTRWSDAQETWSEHMVILFDT